MNVFYGRTDQKLTCIMRAWMKWQDETKGVVNLSETLWLGCPSFPSPSTSLVLSLSAAKYKVAGASQYENHASLFLAFIKQQTDIHTIYNVSSSSLYHHHHLAFSSCNPMQIQSTHL